MIFFNPLVYVRTYLTLFFLCLTIEFFQLLLKNQLSSVEKLVSQNQTGRHCIVRTRLKTKSWKLLKKKKRQLIDIPTGGNNFVDTAFYQNCHQCAVLDNSFPSIYNLTGHEAIRLFLESPVTEKKQLLKNFKKFGNADYNAINALFVEKTVPSKSLHQHQQNEWRIHMVCWRTVWFTICKRTRHRQSLPPWISWYFKYD